MAGDPEAPRAARPVAGVVDADARPAADRGRADTIVLDAQRPAGGHVGAVQLAVDVERAAELARPGRLARISAAEDLGGPDQDCRRMALAVGDEVEAAPHAVDEV